jgi:hypothetical protein
MEEFEFEEEEEEELSLLDWSLDESDEIDKLCELPLLLLSSLLRANGELNKSNMFRLIMVLSTGAKIF